VAVGGVRLGLVVAAVGSGGLPGLVDPATGLPVVHVVQPTTPSAVTTHTSAMTSLSRAATVISGHHARTVQQTKASLVVCLVPICCTVAG
jgi:hypothetical protein